LDKEIIIDRVADILKDTPSAEQIVKKGDNRHKRFRILARYMVEKAIEKDALILESDGLGIAILFETFPNEKENFWKESKENLNLLFNVTGFKNALKILKNQKYIQQQRPKEGAYLYCWFWGIVQNSRGTDSKVGRYMKDRFLKIAERDKLPLYAETQTKKNVIVYRRYGFELFHTWKRDDGNTMWFLRYIPKSLGGIGDPNL
jgi:hypothetical protein